MNDGIPFDPSRMPERDSDGWQWHPDLDDPHWQHPELEEYLNPEAFTAAGLETTQVTMEGDVSEDHSAYQAWINDGSDFSMWEPSKPAGKGWRLIAIYDSENSPVALYVREIVRGHA